MKSGSERNSKQLGIVRRDQLEAGRAASYLAGMNKTDPFRYFKTSREIIRLAVMLYVRFPLSLRNVEDSLHERGIDVSHEAVRYSPALPSFILSLVNVCFQRQQTFIKKWGTGETRRGCVETLSIVMLV